MRIASSKGKAAKRRLESKILHMVRMHNVARDGHCRAGWFFANPGEPMRFAADGDWIACEGSSELAHLENQRRFKTRGMKPELRHTTMGTCMLCTKHHAAYDDRTLRVELLSNAGADGELRWSFR